MPLAIKYVRYSGSSSNLRNVTHDRKRGNIGLGIFPGMPGLTPSPSGPRKSATGVKAAPTAAHGIDIQELLNTDNVLKGAKDVPLFKLSIFPGIR